MKKYNNMDKILEIEKNRKEEDLYVIYLIESGNFYRAYEFSAFLAHNYNNGLTEKEKAKYSKSKNKELGLIINIGFPKTSIGKYMPGLNFENETDNSDGIIKIRLSEEQIAAKEKIEFDKYSEIVDQIKQNIEIKQTTKTNSTTLSNIEIMIMQYPIEEKSMAESFSFIRELKNKIIENKFGKNNNIIL